MDRNHALRRKINYKGVSLSARRAWIEISIFESTIMHDKSLSARRAWIEIGGFIVKAHFHAVALRKESVDRNTHFSDSKH